MEGRRGGGGEEWQDIWRPSFQTILHHWQKSGSQQKHGKIADVRGFLCPWMAGGPMDGPGRLPSDKGTVCRDYECQEHLSIISSYFSFFYLLNY